MLPVTKIERPKAAYIVQLSHLFWGFSYYGVYILILSYFRRALDYDEASAVALMGVYGAIGPMLNFIGGVISDKFLGARRSYLIGFSIYVLGFLFLALSAMNVEENKSVAIFLALLGVAIISLGRGITNVSNEVIMTKAHQATGLEDTLDISYSYNYMMYNTGSVIGKTSFGILLGSSLGIFIGYQIDFFLATAVMIIAVLIQAFNQKALATGVNSADLIPMNTKRITLLIAYIFGTFAFCFFAFHIDVSVVSYIVYTTFVLGISYFLVELLKTSGATRAKMIIALILFFELLIFYIYYNQMFTSLLLYPMNIMKEPVIFGFHVKPETTLVFNPLWCVLGSPIVIGIVSFLLHRGITIHVGYKFAIGLFLSAISYGIFWLSSQYALMAHANQISIWWMFFGHSFVAVAELFVLNLGVATISTLVPKHMTGTVLGIKIMTMSVGSIVGALIAEDIALKPNVVYSANEIFTIYQPFFAKLGIMAAMFGFIFILTTLGIKYFEKKYTEVEK